MTFCLGNASHVFLASPLVARASPPSRQLSPANFRMVNIQCTSSKQPNTKPRVARGITKPRPISPAMQALLGVSEIPRTQALKQIWAYIKQHNLQDPENKKDHNMRRETEKHIRWERSCWISRDLWFNKSTFLK